MASWSAGLGLKQGWRMGKSWTALRDLLMARAIWLEAALATMLAFGASAAERATAPERYDARIAELSRAHGVPERLIRRVIMRESRYAPRLTNHVHYGLMQIKLQTAAGMGYRGGAAGLLDGETNLTYAVPYLANAYLTADRDEDRAVQLYAAGYYFIAKHKGLLSRLRTARSEPLEPEPAIAYAAPPAEPPAPSGPFGFLFQPPVADAAPADQPLTGEIAQAEIEPDAAPPALKAAPLPPRRPANL